jgi:ABC-type antimicrobial peptide transport system permease subunit
MDGVVMRARLEGQRYGVVAGFWVAQRKREIGVRTALGADPRAVRALVLRQGGRLALTGLAAGFLVSVALMRALRSLLYGMSERDPAVYAATAVLIASATALACWIPAERAARIDRCRALRED